MSTRLRERQIKIFYQAPDVTIKETAAIQRYYMMGIPIQNMCRKLQGPRASQHKSPLSYVDVYSILFKLLSEEKIKQRREPKEELTIQDFSRFFVAWKKGGTYQQCRDTCIHSRDAHFTRSVFRTLGNRWRTEQQAELTKQGLLGNSRQPATPKSEFPLKDHILDLGQRCTLGKHPCIIIFLEDIPLAWIKRIRSVPELSLKLNAHLNVGGQLEQIVQDRQTAAQLHQQHADSFPADMLPSQPELSLVFPVESSDTDIATDGMIDAVELAALDPTGEVATQAIQDAAAKGQYGRDLKAAVKADEKLAEERKEVKQAVAEIQADADPNLNREWQDERAINSHDEDLDAQPFTDANLDLSNLLDEDNPEPADEGPDTGPRMLPE